MSQSKDASSQGFLVGAPLDSGPEPALQWVEVASTFQIPSFHVIGLPSPEVAEARERVRAAIESCGMPFPKRRVVLNLSPASVKKRGTGADLAMALALLGAGESRLPARKVVAWGELGLDGHIKPAGRLTRVAYAAARGGADALIVSSREAPLARARMALLREAGLVKDGGPGAIRAIRAIRIIAAETLAEGWALATSPELREPSFTLGESAPPPAAPSPTALLPLSPALERAVALSAAGAHHLLLLGPKGAGKSHALDWLVALQPESGARARAEKLLLAELALDANGDSPNASYFSAIRRVGVHCRPAALVGGGHSGGALRPGEFTLAHGGLLVADEFPEWPRDSREALREPLERGCVTLTRAQASCELKADFTLAANGNLCPCGGWPSEFPLPDEPGWARPPHCSCGLRAREAYWARLQGPVLDRIDMALLVPGLRPPRRPGAANLDPLREAVRRTRAKAHALVGCPSGRAPAPFVEALCREHPEWDASLAAMGVSSLRSRHKIARLALTIALWEGLDAPCERHFFEASFYRPERLALAS